MSYPEMEFPYDRERVRHLLGRMRAMLDEAAQRGDAPSRFLASRDVSRQTLGDVAHEMPVIIWGVPVILDDTLPPNSIILESE